MTNLPPGWAQATLEDLLAPVPRAMTDGPFGSNLTSSHYADSGARVIRLQNIGDGAFRDERAYISLDHFENLRDHEVLAGDLVIASLGDNAPRACIVPNLGEPAIVKADCIRVRPHPLVEARWLLHFLSAPQTRVYASTKIRGVGRPRLGMNVIRGIPIPVPPAAEQRRIVASLDDQLSRLDATENGTELALRRMETLTKRLLVDAVPVPGPRSWRTVSVADAGEVDLGRARHPDWHHGSHMRPYLRVANVFEDRIDLSDVMSMNFPPELFEQYRLKAGDVLLNEGQSPELLGRPALYRGDPPEVAFTNTLLRFRAGPDVAPEWALLVFRRHMHAGRFVREVRITTNIAHLSASRFKSIEFPIPPLAEQRRIVADTERKLTILAQARVSVRAVVGRAHHLRRSLLSEAFAGRLVPQHPGDEPASVLLERIRRERAAQKKPQRGQRRTAAGAREEVLW